MSNDYGYVFSMSDGSRRKRINVSVYRTKKEAQKVLDDARKKGMIRKGGNARVVKATKKEYEKMVRSTFSMKKK